MFKLKQEALLDTKRRLVEKHVSPLKTPSNSEYYYLSEIDALSVSFKTAQHIFFAKPYIEYKAEGFYNSTLPDKEKKTFTSFIRKLPARANILYTTLLSNILFFFPFQVSLISYQK